MRKLFPLMTLPACVAILAIATWPAKIVAQQQGEPVSDLFEAALNQSFAVLDFAIKAGEPRQFAESYGKLTQGCNNCHSTADHQFIVIKPPDATAWPNQEFKPTR